MNNSYIKLYTKFLNWKWYKDTNTKVLFIHLLLKANYEDKEWEGITIKRGECVSSIRVLSKETGLTEREIRTSLDKLYLTHEVTHKTTQGKSLYIVEKYNNYQLDVSKTTQETTHTNNIYSNISTSIGDIRESVRERKEGKEIVNYLNEKTDRNYNYKNKLYQQLITERFDDGYLVEDFKLVIDSKCDEWLSDDKMSAFLQPTTLFGDKFDGYLNKAKAKKKEKTTLEILEGK